MNDSNNNIFDDKNIIPTMQNQPLNNNQISEINNTNVQPQQNVIPNSNQVNIASNFNSLFGASKENANINNEIPQPSQNLNNNIPIQPNNNLQSNNIIQTPDINQNPQKPTNIIPVSPIPTQKSVDNISMQSSQNLNNTNFSPKNKEMNLSSDFDPTANFNDMFISEQNDIPQQSQNNNNISVSSNTNLQKPILEVKGESNTQVQSPENTNNNDTSNQNINTISKDDEELLKAFIGKNYEKITTNQFNIAGFLFTTFYMFYRKMFLYASLAFLLYVALLIFMNNFFVSIVLNILVGLFINKIYLSYANKKISKIKLKNNDKDINELKTICSKKGRTSVGKIFLGFLTELAIIVVVLFIMIAVGIGSIFGQLINFDNWNIITSGTNISTKNATLMEDVNVSGYSCIGSNCSVSIYDSDDNSDDYTLNINNSDLFNKLSDYKNYIKLNIYYTKKGEEKTIVDYKIYLRSNSEDISNIKTENELRDKIGLYQIGTHTDSLTLTEIGFTGIGFNDDESYNYTNYTFINNKNIEYEMNYISKNGEELNLIEGNEYNVTFSVAEGTFDYEYTIISIN